MTTTDPVDVGKPDPALLATVRRDTEAAVVYEQQRVDYGRRANFSAPKQEGYARMLNLARATLWPWQEVDRLTAELAQHVAAIRAVEAVLNEHDKGCVGVATDFAERCDCTSGKVREALALSGDNGCCDDPACDGEFGCACDHHSEARADDAQPKREPCGDPYSGIGCPVPGCTHDDESAYMGFDVSDRS